MSKKTKAVWSGVLGLGLLALLAAYLHSHTIAVLQPRGTIGRQERGLMIFAFYLMLLVIVPVFILLFTIAWRYREGNHKNVRYTPEWDHHPVMEIVWWGIPCAIIFTLAVLAWHSSHTLDPYRSLASTTKPLTIQVVALDWKWLFIYPEQQIASLNYVQFPNNTPIDFQITSDAPMNSFWIPQLGGQIYAMSGMSTHLHLMADHTGSYRGVSANISGKGFAGMDFTARSTPSSDFDTFVRTVRAGHDHLDLNTYDALAKPAEQHDVRYYASATPGLYESVVMKYMLPAGNGGSY